MEVFIAEQWRKLLVDDRTSYSVKSHDFRNVTVFDCMLEKRKHVFDSTVDCFHHPSIHCYLNKINLITKLLFAFLYNHTNTNISKRMTNNAFPSVTHSSVTTERIAYVVCSTQYN